MGDDLLKEIVMGYFGLSSRRKPICNKCEFEKLGLTTICEYYKRIPESVQKGGYCEKFSEIKE